MPVSCPSSSLPEERTTGGSVRTLELEVTARDVQSYQIAARSDAGDVQGVVSGFPLDDRELERHREAVREALLRSAATTRRAPPAGERPLRELGALLFDFLFPAEVRELLAAVSSQAAREGDLLQLRLRIRPPELAALPWELLYDRRRDEYLCLQMPLVRHLEVPEPVQPLAVSMPLRVLAMVAAPADLAELDVEREKQRLQDALARPAAAGLVQVTWVAGQTWQDLQAALDPGDHQSPRQRPGWHVFHFIGHGGFDEGSGEGFLALADENGGTHRLGASNLGLLLRHQRSLRLVVLNACESARASAGDAYSSTAAALMRRGVTAVVAMQYEISDDSAIDFSRCLYDAVARRFPADEAILRTRIAIKVNPRNSLEWVIPVLYLRSPRGELFDPGAPPTGASTTTVRPDGRPGDQRQDHIPPEPAVRPSPARSRGARRPGSPLRRMDHGDRVEVVAFSPDGSRLATGSTDRTARVWAVETGEPLATLEHRGGVLAVAFSPDGSRLATGSYDGTARLWDAETGEHLATLEHRGGVLAVAFSADGAWLATGSYDGSARLWEVGSAERPVRMRHPSIMAMAFSPDGTRLVTGGQTEARLWDAETGEQVTQLAHDGAVLAVAFSPDGTRLATGSQDRTAKVWAAASGQRVARLEHGGGVLAVAFSADGTRLGTGSYDNTARIWEVRTQAWKTLVRHDSILAVTLSPDGRWLATGSGDETALLWDVETSKELGRMRHENRVVAVTFSPGGDLLATGSGDKTARLWAA
jgi:WD40 repeat protein